MIESNADPYKTKTEHNDLIPEGTSQSFVALKGLPSLEISEGRQSVRLGRPIKSLGKRLVDATLVPLVNYIFYNSSLRRTLSQELSQRTTAECADYVQAKMAASVQFQRREPLWDFALRRMPPRGLIAEFGVWNGQSINYFAKVIPGRTIFGFDSFLGLREDWAGTGQSEGAFSRNGRLPKVLPNVQLIKGWFHETLPDFLQTNTQDFSFLHIDCDTYEGTKTLFDVAGHRIQPGTVIVFDEYFGYRGWKLGEFKVWQEWRAARGVAYEYLAFSEQQVAIRVTSISSTGV